MLMKLAKSDKYWKALFLVGIITLVFGIVIYRVVTVEAHNISMLKGMIIGGGVSLTLLAGTKLLKDKMSSEEELKAQEIEVNDERNTEILRLSLSISSTAATLLFTLLAFIFVAMDYIIPAFMSIGALYIQLLAFFIGYKYFSDKM